MIPLHRPAFGLGTALAAAMGSKRGRSRLPDLESAYATASGGARAVWLPSARAGICWALRAATDQPAQAIGPAFTCPVVHEAMVRSGRNVQLIDAGANGFEMDLPTLLAAQQGDFALVLSEPYGHAYELDALARCSVAPPKLRIVDSAMALAHRTLFARLHANDFAVLSFGLSKSMYAGWGGMGFTLDASLAAEVARQRDHWLARADAKLALKRALKTTVRAVSYYPHIYPAARNLWSRAQSIRSRLRRTPPQTDVASNSTELATPWRPPEWSDDSSCGPEWRLPSTYSDRRLALWNLETAEAAHASRLEQATRYARNLADVDGLRLPPESVYALSHYTVRVPVEFRDHVKEELRSRGVATLSLWPFYPHLDPDRYPNALRLSFEVISLPLSPWLTAVHVDRICEAVRQCVAACAP